MMELDRTLAGLSWLRDKTTCFACSGCGMEHNCSDDGCRIIRSAIEQVQKLSRELSTSEAARTELWKQLISARQELAEVKAERECAIADLKKLKDCSVCAYLDTDCPHGRCKDGEKFRWRGLKEA